MGLFLLIFVKFLTSLFIYEQIALCYINTGPSHLGGCGNDEVDGQLDLLMHVS